MAARADVDTIDWRDFKYMVYDIPNMQGTYEERYNALGASHTSSWLLTLHSERGLQHHTSPYVQLAPKELCKGMQHLEAYFQDIMDQGGEGIILRDPTCLLEPGRSHGYLKHKVQSPPREL